MEYVIVDKYQNNGYTITIRVPKMTKSEKLEAERYTFRRLSSVIKSFVESTETKMKLAETKVA